jgi:signal transduction histidine kinase
VTLLGAVRRRSSAAVRDVRAGPFDLGVDDYEAWTREGSPAHRAIVARSGGFLAVVIGLYGIGVVLVDRGPAGPDGFALGVAVWAFATGVVMISAARRIPVWADDTLAVAASVMLAVLGRRGGTLGIAIPAIYVCVGILMSAVRRWQVAVAHLCHFGVSYAVVVATAPGYHPPLTWWVGLMAAVVTCSGFVRWLVRNIGVLVVAEHDAREAAEEASAGLVVVSRAKSEFLARMSHELRTPLNAILGFADVLHDQLVGPLNERQVAYTEDIAESGRHLLSLVDDVLDLSKVESGSIDLDVGPVDIARTLEDARVLVRERSREQGIRVAVHVERGVAAVYGDERKIRQIVVNLVANAVKFTPRNGRVTVMASPMRGGGVRIEVADTGVGIAADDLERIFEQFEQVTGTGSEGTGLGLAVARRLVDRHGGRLSVESTPGAGSTFTVELPLRPPAAVVDPASREATGVATAAPHDEHVDVFEAILVPGSFENRELIVSTARAFSTAAAVLAVVFAVITPGPVGIRAAVAALALVSLGVGSVVSRFGQSISFAALEGLPVFGTLAITAFAWIAPGYADLIALAYVWIALTRYAVWDHFRGLVQIALSAVCFGVVLVAHPQLTDRGARWLSLVFLLVVNGLLARWIVGKLRRLAVDERAARRVAEQAQAELVTTSAHKNDFLASMSHELRTPLNAIIGFSDVLAAGHAGPLDERQRGYVDDIAESGRHLLALINDILDLAKLDAGQFALQPEPVVTATVVERAVSQVVAETDAIARRVALTWSCADDLVIHVDHGRIEQVLVNVIENAVKFTPDDGAVQVSVERHDDEVHVAVSDTGIGIHPTIRRTIFDAFQQGSEVPAPARDGTGLGLALAKAIVELHGGRIWVESEPGVGSTFTVALPARLATAAGAEAVPA